MTASLHGLVAATHTPFDAEGRLNLSVVEGQAAHLHRSGVRAVFIGGTTGESHSLTVAERRALAEEWATVVRGSPLRMVLHVGSSFPRYRFFPSSIGTTMAQSILTGEGEGRGAGVASRAPSRQISRIPLRGG